MFDLKSTSYVKHAVSELDKAIKNQNDFIEKEPKSDEEIMSAIEGIALLITVKSFLVDVVIDKKENLKKYRKQWLEE